MTDKTNREMFVERGQEVIQLAWDIGGAPGVQSSMEAEARITNGLYAIAIVEIMARPEGRGFIGLRDALKEQDVQF